MTPTSPPPLAVTEEVRRNVAALRALLEELGPAWEAVTADVTEGDAGNGERLTFLYLSRRVHPSGLNVEFVLATLHVLWGENPARRLPEIAALAEWMRR